MFTSFSIVIPTYNGLNRLKENLPQLISLYEKTDINIEWIVVDDGSTDKTEEWLHENYPFVDLVKNESNLGFINTANRGVKKASNDLVVLLNNDVTANSDFISPSLKYFENPDIFAVTFKALYPENMMFREGAKGAIIRGGMMHIRHSERHEPKRKSYGIPSLYAVGGHCILRRSVFLDLKGFDEIFSPFYWEDTDLGFRAWKNGYKIVYEPECEVIHNEHGTIKSIHSINFIKKIRYRNRLLFIWKNFENKSFFLLHIFFLLLRVLFSWMTLNFKFYSYFYSALKVSSIILLRRKSEKSKINYKQIFNELK